MDDLPINYERNEEFKTSDFRNNKKRNSNQKYGGDLLLKKYKRQTVYKKKKKLNLCLKIFGGVLHRRISHIFELRSRTERILAHITCFFMNVLSLGCLGYFFFFFECCLSSRNVDSFYTQLSNESNYIESSVDVREISRPISTVSQETLLKLKFKITAKEIQQQLMSLNTFLFVVFPNEKYGMNQKEKIEKNLCSWNILVEKLLEFCKTFFNGFKKIKMEDKRIQKLYRGEYDYTIEDMNIMNEIDQKTIGMMFYKSNINVKNKYPFQKSWFNLLKEYESILINIKERLNRKSFFIPQKHIEDLPNNAKYVLKYSKAFEIWEESKKDIRKFLEFYKIDYDFICGIEKEKYSEKESLLKKDRGSITDEKRKLTELQQKFENICVIWKEKKGKIEQNSRKLKIAKEILDELNNVSKDYSFSKLSILKKSSTDDIVNMIRNFLNEILLGRVSLLQKYLQKPVKEVIENI